MVWNLGLCPHAPWISKQELISLSGIVCGSFSNLHSFSVAQNAGGSAQGFHNQNWIALPEGVVFDQVPLHPWQW
jgi:tetrahydromethanopterin S-methyltransferase subunit D